MKKLRVLIIIWLLVVFGTVICSSCMEEERIGLLKLKSFLETIKYLPTWVDNVSSECCGWEGVECSNNIARRVIGLNLSSMGEPARMIDVDAPDDYNYFVLDASLFLPFQQLRYLDLSSNYFWDLQNDQEFGRMKKLEVLILQWNLFDNTRVFQSLSALTSLTVLDLSDNNINGSLSDFGRDLCRLKKLQELNLAWNFLSGTIPECFNNLTSLKSLDLAFNNLAGNLDPLTLSTSLEYLSLYYNQQLDPSLLFKSVTGPRFQFKYLDLSNCNLKTSTTDLVKFLSSQPNLKVLYLSNNKVHGQISNSFFKNSSNLKVLVLRNNSLTGDIQFLVGPHLLNLMWFDISDNYIKGKLQSNIGRVFPKLKILNMADTDLSGGIPSSFGNMKELNFLYLSNNNLSGKLPESLGLSCQRLTWIELQNNKLEGRIPDTFFNLTQLTVLDVSSNKFSGVIPSNKFQSFSLEMLDISQNHISGRIPHWLGANLTNQLRILAMQNNFIRGYIPQKLCNLTSLEVMDLSQNQLSGPMPSCLTIMHSLQHLNLEGNKLTGSLPNVSDESGLMSLNLSHNNLSGEIPFGLASDLVVLLLKGNHFSGTISPEFCHFHFIAMIDISHNNLSGSLPLCFSNMTIGKRKTGFSFSSPYSMVKGVYIEHDIFRNLIIQSWKEDDAFQEVEFKVDVEFLTKSRSNSYKGEIINYMSGVDLSCNNLNGSIPRDIGALTEIRALNLSHNHFTGVIPSSLSNMSQIESLDFSHNKLSGEIPSNLTRLTTLADFSVAYNNLSGRVPEMVAQFSTFNESSYEGNPFLCGPPLLGKQCNINEVWETIAEALVEKNNMFGIDTISFLASFAASYVTCFVGFVIVLWINPYWRRRWFHLIDACLSFMFPFWSEAIYTRQI